MTNRRLGLGPFSAEAGPRFEPLLDQLRAHASECEREGLASPGASHALSSRRRRAAPVLPDHRIDVDADASRRRDRDRGRQATETIGPSAVLDEVCK